MRKSTIFLEETAMFWSEEVTKDQLTYKSQSAEVPSKESSAGGCGAFYTSRRDEWNIHFRGGAGAKLNPSLLEG